MPKPKPSQLGDNAHARGGWFVYTNAPTTFRNFHIFYSFQRFFITQFEPYILYQT